MPLALTGEFDFLANSVCVSVCVFPAPWYHLPRTSYDSKMDSLEAY